MNSIGLLSGSPLKQASFGGLLWVGGVSPSSFGFFLALLLWLGVGHWIGPEPCDSLFAWGRGKEPLFQSDQGLAHELVSLLFALCFSLQPPWLEATSEQPFP